MDKNTLNKYLLTSTIWLEVDVCQWCDYCHVVRWCKILILTENNTRLLQEKTDFTMKIRDKCVEIFALIPETSCVYEFKQTVDLIWESCYTKIY